MRGEHEDVPVDAYTKPPCRKTYPNINRVLESTVKARLPKQNADKSLFIFTYVFQVYRFVHKILIIDMSTSTTLHSSIFPCTSELEQVLLTRASSRCVDFTDRIRALPDELTFADLFSGTGCFHKVVSTLFETISVMYPDQSIDRTVLWLGNDMFFLIDLTRLEF